MKVFANSKIFYEGKLQANYEGIWNRGGNEMPDIQNVRIFMDEKSIFKLPIGSTFMGNLIKKKIKNVKIYELEKILIFRFIPWIKIERII